ncbi:MAG: T9SS type A sorting domain-containing protein [Bacteroidetes bacterium]|nr:T9SS type A sorting domain-containing protein [Bacteroidota bacterium]
MQNLVVNNNGDIWVAGDRDQIAKYDGTTWTTFDSIYSNTGNMALKRVRSFANDSKGNIYFANMSEPRVNTTSQDYVLVKYDGQNFNVLTTQPAEVPSWLLHVIAVDSNDHIWYGNKFNYLIEYDGQNFSYYTPPQNMPLGIIWAVIVDNYNQKWVAADSGIYKLSGNIWTEYKYRDLGLIRGYPGSRAYDIAIDKNNNVWFATNWGMVQFNPNGIVTDVEDENVVNIPKEFKLSQNYPNPFNPKTSIKYQLSALSFVSLKVFDVLGREVAILVNEEKPAGTHTINFNAKGLSSGVYFYRLKAGSFVQTKKLILMK